MFDDQGQLVEVDLEAIFITYLEEHL